MGEILITMDANQHTYFQHQSGLNNVVESTTTALLLFFLYYFRGLITHGY